MPTAVRPEEPRSGVSKDEATDGAAWFETALARLLTMRVNSGHFASSFERFVGILIEHYEGAFPAWLAPTQAVIMNITDKQADFAAEVEKTLNQSGFRAKSDLRNEKIGFKIREHTIQRTPYLVIVGDQEVENGTLSVRTRAGEDLGSTTLAEFSARLMREIEQRNRNTIEH